MVEATDIDDDLDPTDYYYEQYLYELHNARFYDELADYYQLKYNDHKLTKHYVELHYYYAARADEYYNKYYESKYNNSTA